jgi:hypothetical protein
LIVKFHFTIIYSIESCHAHFSENDLFVLFFQFLELLGWQMLAQNLDE